MSSSFGGNMGGFRERVKIKYTKEPFIEIVENSKIESVKFSMLSGDEIRKASEVEVWKKDYYIGQEPVPNALLDRRMGPTKFPRGVRCETCDGDYDTCPGHFGYLKLVLPVFNVGYFNIILKILKCICKSCFRILLPEKDSRRMLKRMRGPKMDALQKTSIVKEMIKRLNTKFQCSRCGYVNGKVLKKAGSGLCIVHDRSKVIDETLEDLKTAISHTKVSKTEVQRVELLNPVRVLSIFRKILDEDCELLFLGDRPEKLILTDIAVPPIAVRPSVLTGQMSNEDDITVKLKQIIQMNSNLREDLHSKAESPKYLIAWDSLQVEVAQYINSEVSGVPQPDVPTRGFVQRLSGKEGRLRGNLSGKRVNYTGRTVISPDPNLKITELGVPILMAQLLTFPEKVTHHNIKKLQRRIRNGPSKYPGANYVHELDGSLKWLKIAPKRAADSLQIGCTVERHLEDGDVVLFNRQPSLHRMSIMCHRVKVMPWRTLRFNESVCNPYNADFDGDEMNIHVPQTAEARAEALTLMGVQDNLCTPKNGEILVASTQDFLTSSFLITRKDTFYDRASFSLMCSYMGDGMDHVDLPTPALVKPIELWTGKQLFSVLVRPHAGIKVYLNLTVKEKSYSKGETMCPKDGFVYFRNSELICGQLGKATLGNGNKDGLFSVLLRDYNAHGGAACMNRLAKLSARWIGNHGFSIGIDDVQPGEVLAKSKMDEINKGYSACRDLIQKYNKEKLSLQAGNDAAVELEAGITSKLNEIREATANVCMKDLHWRNSPLIMSQCGSKGSPINISQMIACVGQQSVGGCRAPDGFIDRTLPHFPRKSKEPDAKGFVANSFYTGLTATEFFFHTMGGREGLVDTAVKTAETGYMSRRLMKALEDLSIQYDNTVRNSSGAIVQFLYGDDGMDPSKMEGKSGIPLNMERLFLKVKATCPSRGRKESKDKLLPSEQFLLPSEIFKFVDARLSRHDMTLEGGCSDAFNTSLREFLKEKIAKLYNTRTSFQLDGDNVESNSSISLQKIAANISGITLKQLEVFLETCISRYHLKAVDAGTAIGAIGAQSIGEPGTQMTLKTFHFAGVASMNVTLGVPRIKEIVDGSKNIKTPIITAVLDCDDDERSARLVKASIEKTVLGEVAKSINVVLTSRKACVIVILDMERIQSLQLRISAYTVKQSILDNRPKIKYLLEKDIVPVDCKKLIISPSKCDKCELHFLLHYLRTQLPQVVVKGIPSVKRVVIRKNEKNYDLLVEGTNFRAVMGIPGVNGCKTKYNHIIEVNETLGIEAARKCIIEEINTTMASHGMSIDVRHMMLLADVMTYRGEVLGITRFGVQRMKESVLMLASFEKMAEHLFNGAINGRVDKCEGVSECIIMGKPMPCGTGMFKIRHRVDHIPQLNYGSDPVISC